MVTTLVPIVSVPLKPVHSEKALSPISVTELGMTRFPEKAALRNMLTGIRSTF